MLISLASMNFRLSHLLREKLTMAGFSFEQISPGGRPSKGCVLVVTTKKDESVQSTAFNKKVVLTKSEVLNINRAFSKIMLGLEGKRVWESLIIGIDPGLSIGVAVVADGSLRSSLETREVKEAVNFTLTALNDTPAKMAIIRVGSTGGYRRILILNELLNVKPKEVSLEVVNELNTTSKTLDCKEALRNGKDTPAVGSIGKDVNAAVEIALRLGENVTCPEEWKVSKGELKEIQVLSRQYSQGKVTISKKLARKVACGLISINEAIRIQKQQNKNNAKTIKNE